MTLGLYVHIPFCHTKCNYCDFVSHTQTSEQLKNDYLASVIKEGEMYRQSFAQDKKITTVFIGGGTPTCLSSGQLAYLVTFLRKVFEIPFNTEWTVEANPGTVTKDKLLVLQELGINRISLGVQAWQERHLKRLGRIHSSEVVIETVQLLKDTGFNNFNLDLMYGLPEQTMEEWLETLQEAIKLEPKHLSVYQLKIEEDTPFAKEYDNGIIDEFDNCLAAQMYEKSIEYLQANGFNHYEISNFAKSGYECFHNKVYWLNGDYLGLGVAAASHLPGVRFTNKVDVVEYINLIARNELPLADKEEINLPLAIAETMFLGLRMIEGVNKEHFFMTYHQQISDVYNDVIEKLKKRNLLSESLTHYYLTKQGLMLANEVMADFLP